MLFSTAENYLYYDIDFYIKNSYYNDDFSPVSIWFQEAYCILQYGFYFILSFKCIPMETMLILLLKVNGKIIPIYIQLL